VLLSLESFTRGEPSALSDRGSCRRPARARGDRSRRGRRTWHRSIRVAWEPGRPCGSISIVVGAEGQPNPKVPGPRPASGLAGANTGARDGTANRTTKEGRLDGPQGVGAPHSSVGGRGTCATGTLPSEGGASSRNGRWATGRGLRAPGAVHATPAGSRAHVSPRRDEPDALVGQVRICGRGGGQPPSRPGPLFAHIPKPPKAFP
jgi:hypothetical protein